MGGYFCSCVCECVGGVGLCKGVCVSVFLEMRYIAQAAWGNVTSQ